MTAPRHIAVIDIGKTNAKLALVDLETLEEHAVVTRPNAVRPGPPYPHVDVDGHWDFILDGLARFHAAHRVDAISVTTHGACCALLDAAGGLAAPVLDYEHDGPDTCAADYDALRPDFAVTGSPRLPVGLNLGAQLFWQFRSDPALRDRTARIVTWPQFWSWRLTGVASTDVTSLGCHTDLWLPHEGRFSPLAEALGVADKIAPARHSSDVLGTILPGIAARTGLAPTTPVTCGIHDSNASLLPHLIARDPPFSVVSTGTWVVTMAVGGLPVRPDPERDTLVNVDAMGQPVPSARFMGGREHEIISAGAHATPTDDDIAAVLRGQTMLLPAVAPGSGPFARRAARWVGTEPPVGSGQRSVALAFYLALMTAECLRLVGHAGTVVVEGAFARNAAYLSMLSAATGCPVRASAAITGTSAGAALLFRSASGGRVPLSDRMADPLPGGAAYATAWREHVA